MGFFDGLFNAATLGLYGGIKDTVGYGVKSLFGQSDNQKYRRQLNQQAEYQKQMIDYQNEKSKEMTLFNNAEQLKNTKDYQQWSYDNFNSASAQMANYQKAGINPNLIAGNVSGAGTGAVLSSGSSSASAPAGAPGVNSSSQYLNSLLDYQIMSKELEGRELDNEYRRLEIERLKNEFYAPDKYVDFDSEGNVVIHGIPNPEYRGSQAVRSRNYKQVQSDESQINARELANLAKYNADKLYDTLRSAGLTQAQAKGLNPIMLEFNRLAKNNALTDKNLSYLEEKINEIKLTNEDLELTRNGAENINKILSKLESLGDAGEYASAFFSVLIYLFDKGALKRPGSRKK